MATVNYSRIANFLRGQEQKALANCELDKFERIHKKLNRLFVAWGKSYKNYKRISEIKMKPVSMKRS